MSSSTSYIDLMRHGETTGGFAFRGSLDDALTDLGRAQMQAGHDRHGPWQQMISSPLRRCLAPAQDWSREAGIALQEEPRLREMHFGAWEGRTAAELMESEPEALGRFWQDPLNHIPPGAEPLVAFRERVLLAWEAALTRRDAGPQLLVTHGGVIRLILLHVQQRPLSDLLKLEVPHACVFRIHLQAGGTVSTVSALGAVEMEATAGDLS
ncbi:MAG: histidine phosphatase family protein [Pseudomonadota bacterium]